MSIEMAIKWIFKAEQDIKMANLGINSDFPLNGLSCYQAQQCVEKYMKAWLIYQKIEVLKTHNINILLEQCINTDSSFINLKEKETGILSEYVIEARYPGDWIEPTPEETIQAIALAEAVRSFMRQKFKISGIPIDEKD